ncbi:MAG: Ig-like domain-containing protein, partial [Deltaproteobacteria bacterium]|nr:Ig-like domain-containing protein [Deltaproteobacteria bacterium]
LGCPAVPDISSDAGTTGPFRVGPEGGEVIREGVVLVVPPGALDTEIILSVTVVDTGIPEVPERKRISFGYRVSPSNLVLRAPVTLRIPWQEDRRVSGVKPSAYDVRRNQGTEPYLALPGATLDPDVPGMMKAESERLGTFWITSPALPTVSALELTPEESAVGAGQAQQLTARVLDAAGDPIPDVPVTWTVLPPRMGSVDAAGLFTAASPGTAYITAEAAGLTAEAVVRVQGTTVGPSTFVHETPFPTGNDLHGALHANGHLAVVGDNGTVLVRSPLGSWTRTFSSPGVTLTAVAGPLPGQGVAVGSVGTQGAVVSFGAGAQATFKAFPTCTPRAAWFDGTHGMAVGDGNDVLVYRNGQWEAEYSPSFESLLSVVGDGQGGFVTLGNLGSLYKFDPVTRSWDSLFQARLSVQLSAGLLLDAAGSEAWAVGGGKLWHFAFGAWTPVNLPSSPVLDAHTSLSLVDGRVVVGGRKGPRGYLLWRPVGGGGWKFRTMRGPQVPRGLSGAGGLGVAVGDRGMLWEYTQDNFEETSRGPYGDVVDLAVTAADVLAAMNTCLDDACWVKEGSVLVRAADGSWSALGGPQPFAGEVTALAARSASEVYVATPSVLYRYDGQAWTSLAVTGATPAAFTRLGFCGTALWVVGPAGGMWKGTPAPAGGPVSEVVELPVSLLAPTQDLQALHCAEGNEMWVGGNGTLLQGRSARNSANFRHADWRAVWSPAQGECFAFGDAPFAFHWDTKRLRLVDQLGPLRPDVIHSAWGSKPDNVFAVGMSSLPARFAFALRFDGLQWLPVDPGTGQEPLVIRGRSDTELWLGTRSGGLLRAVVPATP